jgi:ABC-type multidrug transport system fused ATPase/permease subunit
MLLIQDMRQSIMLIDSFPFVFSGTIRENLDPYHRYTD